MDLTLVLRLTRTELTIVLDNIIMGIHLLGAVIWIGGMFIGVLIRQGLAKAWANDHRSYEISAGEIDKFPGRVIWAGFAAAVLTGIYNLTWYVPGGLGGLLSFLPYAPWLLAKLVLVGVLIVCNVIYVVYVRPAYQHGVHKSWSPEQLRGLLRLNNWLTFICIAASFAIVFVSAFM